MMRPSHPCAIPGCENRTYGDICHSCGRVLTYWHHKPPAARIVRVRQLDKWQARMTRVTPVNVATMRRKRHA